MKLSIKQNTDGFKELQKKAKSHMIEGVRFTQLIFFLSEKFPNIRFSFTSPHPKDFPISLLNVISSKFNIAKSIHLPIQSGNDFILNKMKRYYTQKSYLNLVEECKKIIPNVVVSSDFIVGFCSETEEMFEDTLNVCEKVKFDIAYMFKYSLRPKTHAFHNYVDDVDQKTKDERLTRLIELIKKGQLEQNKSRIGLNTLVLIEGNTKKEYKKKSLFGKNEGGLNCIVEDINVNNEKMVAGDWVLCEIVDFSANTIFCVPKQKSKILSDFEKMKLI